MRSENLGLSIVAGALGGLVASAAMNQFQAAVSALSKSIAEKNRIRRGEPPPEPKPKSSGDSATVRTAEAISTKLFNHGLTEDQKKWAGPAVHYGFGAAVGALYGALAPVTPVHSAAGTSYGAAVWLGADEIALPLVGLSGPPTASPISVHMNALASHLVFGAVTHLTRKLILS